MPLFTYKGKDDQGKVYQDTIQASGKGNAVTTLKSQGVQVLTIKQVGGLKDMFSGRISVAEKAAFCRFMSTMLKSGMGLPEAVEMIRQESKNKKMQEVLADVSYQTKKGKTLSSVLQNYKKDFDPVFLTMVRVGEESGTLEKSFGYLSKQLTASHELAQTIKGSLMYPAVIVVAMFGNGLLMAVFVLPRLSSAFLKLEVPLPFYTKALLAVGQFFGDNTVLVIIFTIIFAISFFAMFIIRPTREFMVSVVSKAPVAKSVVKLIDVARYSRTLSTLLRSGVPIIEALDVSAESISRSNMRDKAKKFSESVAKGESLSDILTRDKNLFPTVMVQTIRAGEQSGSMEEVLDEVAEFFEKEVQFSLKKLTSLIEPVLMLVIGVVVGVMVIMMIAPIYSIISGLQTTIEQQ